MKDKQYTNFISEIKKKVLDAQLKTVVAANSQMLLLYWQLGRMILENQQKEGWGAKIIDNLSKDLNKEFPELKGFSPRNLKYMRKFAENYTLPLIQSFISIESHIKSAPSITQKLFTQLLNSDNEQFLFVQQAVAQLNPGLNQIMQQPAALSEDTIFIESILAKVSWSHHIILLDKETHLGKRFWYMLNSIENGISRNVLAMQIESGLFERQVVSKKINNFERVLPLAQSDFANYLLKDPYIFDFVQAREKADERNIEEQLANHITKFLLELGQGFAFIGRQVRFEIGDADFYADLLFYHTKLHAYVVVELKAQPFEPGDVSQLNFYVNVVNDKLKTTDDNHTIGLLLCKGKNQVVAEYALRGYSNAINVSDYQISKAIPEELKSALPQIEDIENEMNDSLK